MSLVFWLFSLQANLPVTFAIVSHSVTVFLEGKCGRAQQMDSQCSDARVQWGSSCTCDVQTASIFVWPRSRDTRYSKCALYYNCNKLLFPFLYDVTFVGDVTMQRQSIMIVTLLNQRISRNKYVLLLTVIFSDKVTYLLKPYKTPAIYFERTADTVGSIRQVTVCSNLSLVPNRIFYSNVLIYFQVLRKTFWGRALSLNLDYNFSLVLIQLSWWF